LVRGALLRVEPAVVLLHGRNHLRGKAMRHQTIGIVGGAR
jgi:hypothetical protein